MADNLSVEAPDFDLVRKETGRATEDALRTLWFSLNGEMSIRRQNAKRDNDRLQGKILVSDVSANQDNFDSQNALIILFTNAGAFNLTGIRNPAEGRLIVIHNVGAGTKTVKNASANSDALNRIRTNSGGDISITQDKTVIVIYANSLWREVKLA